MAFLEKYLRVKKSLLPGAGKGLFTKTDIVKGTRIVEYKGKKRKWVDAKHEDGYNGYLMRVTRTLMPPETSKQVMKFLFPMEGNTGR